VRSRGGNRAGRLSGRLSGRERERGEGASTETHQAKPKLLPSLSTTTKKSGMPFQAHIAVENDLMIATAAKPATIAVTAKIAVAIATMTRRRPPRTAV